MKYFLIILTLFLFSCKAVELSKVKKQIIPPGQPTEVITIHYGAKLVTKNELTIQSISLSNHKEVITSFVVTDLKSGVLKQKEDTLTKGEYYVEFKINYLKELAGSEDTVYYHVSTKGKEKVLSRVSYFER